MLLRGWTNDFCVLFLQEMLHLKNWFRLITAGNAGLQYLLPIHVAVGVTAGTCSTLVLNLGKEELCACVFGIWK